VRAARTLSFGLLLALVSALPAEARVVLFGIVGGTWPLLDRALAASAPEPADASVDDAVLVERLRATGYVE
jgi:hypothetical protein